MKKIDKKSKLLFVMAITLVMFMVGSYAWLTLTLNGSKNNILRAGTLEMILDDSSSDGILIEKAVPMSDTKGLATDAYTFTLKNTGSVNADYTIYLDDLALDTNEVRMKDQYVKYSLVKNDGNTVTELLSNTGVNPNRVIDLGTLAPNVTNTYKLRIWIDSDADNDVMGTVFYSKLRVEAEQHLYSVLKGIDKSQNLSKVVFKNTIEKPVNTVSEFDVSQNGDGSIMQYNVLNENATTYTAYVEANGKMSAPVNATSLFEMNDSSQAITSIEGLSMLNTSKTTNMSRMFRGVKSSTLDVSSLDTSSTTDMSYMFDGNSSLTQLDLSMLDFSKVTTIQGMLWNMNNLATLNINGMKANNLTNFENMFVTGGDDKLAVIHANNMELNGITTLGLGEIRSLVGLKELNMSHLTANKLNNIDQFVSNSEFSNIDLVDLSYLNAKELTSLEFAFYGSTVKEINLSHINTPKLTNMYNTFFSTKKLETINLTGSDLSSVTNITNLFRESTVQNIINMNSIDFDKTTQHNNVFYGSPNIKTIDLGDCTNLSNPDSLLASTQASEIIAKNLNMSSPTFITTIASNSNLVSLNLSGATFNFQLQTGMLQSATLKNLDLSNVKFSTAQTEFSGTFSSSLFPKIETIILENAVADNITNISGMFAGNSNLQSVNMNGFVLNKITNTNGMFSSNTKLTSLKINKMDFSNVTQYGGMLGGVPSSISVIVKDSDAKTFITSRLSEVGNTTGSVTIG